MTTTIKHNFVFEIEGEFMEGDTGRGPDIMLDGSAGTDGDYDW
jgi:hypothetical protein